MMSPSLTIAPDVHPSATSALSTSARQCWTGQTHPWLHSSSASSTETGPLIDRYRVLDAQIVLTGLFRRGARAVASPRLPRRLLLVLRRLRKSPRQVGECRNHTVQSTRPSISILGSPGNRSFHLDTAYRTSGGSSCANRLHALPAPFTGIDCRVVAGTCWLVQTDRYMY